MILLFYFTSNKYFISSWSIVQSPIVLTRPVVLMLMVLEKKPSIFIPRAVLCKLQIDFPPPFFTIIVSKETNRWCRVRIVRCTPQINRYLIPRPSIEFVLLDITLSRNNSWKTKRLFFSPRRKKKSNLLSNVLLYNRHLRI